MMKIKQKKQKPSFRLTSFESLENKYYGKKGMAKREAYEAAFKEEFIGEIIKQIREKQNLTQEELAQILKVNKSNISKIENNLKSIRMDTFFRVIEALKAKMTIKLEFGKIYREVKFASQ
jgi:HTH-type transcriptional regulator / antitoxin HipB